MADLKLKRRIRDFFRREFVNGPGESVRVTDGCADNVHVAVVSHKFDGLGMWASEQLVNEKLFHHFPQDVWKMISLTETYSPESNGLEKAQCRPEHP